MARLTVLELCDGGVADHLAEALPKVLDNIRDHKTEAEDERRITLEIRFKPDDNRELVSIACGVKLKLAGKKKSTGVARLKTSGGQLALFAEEAAQQDPEVH